MSHNSDDSCRLPECDNAPGSRSAFCSIAHRMEYRKQYKRDHMRRERGTTSTLDDDVAPQSGRSIPRSPDSWTPPTIQHPSRRFARPGEPDLVDYTEPGMTQRPGIHQRPAPRTDLQRFRAPSVEDESWAPQGDEDYYAGVTFERNDMSQGPYRSPNCAGIPVGFQVVRRSR